MRVLMTADAVGGVWTYALDVAAGLAARGDVVTLAVLGPAPSPAQRGAADALHGVEVVEMGLPLDWLARDAGELRTMGRRLAQLAPQRQVDIVHLNSPALAAGAGFTAPVVGVTHSCVGTWWAAVKGGALDADFGWQVEAQRAGLAACDAVLAPSAAFAEAVAALYGVRPAVVRNGRAPPATAGEGPRLRRVVTAGRLWDKAKGLETFDRMAARLDAPAVAFGQLRGPQGETAALTHAQAGGVLGRAALEAEVARSRVFASTAVYEPFGLAVLEAAQAGCALVLSDIPTFRELWSGAAVFAPAWDAAAFAAATQALLDDEAAAARLGAKARARAARYSLDACVDGVATAYRSVTAPAPLSAEAAA